MKKTPWYPGTVKPVREGWYERDYSNTCLDLKGFYFLDLWQQRKPGDGFWYVDEHGEINDAYYTDLPWRGVQK